MFISGPYNLVDVATLSRGEIGLAENYQILVFKAHAKT